MNALASTALRWVSGSTSWITQSSHRLVLPANSRFDTTLERCTNQRL
jgi:hypothetical protein